MSQRSARAKFVLWKTIALLLVGVARASAQTVPSSAPSPGSAADIMNRLAQAVSWTHNCAVKMHVVSTSVYMGPDGNPTTNKVEGDTELYCSPQGEILLRSIYPGKGANYTAYISSNLRVYLNQSMGKASYTDDPTVVASYGVAYDASGRFLDGNMGGISDAVNLTEIPGNGGSISSLPDENIGGLECKVIQLSDQRWNARAWIAPDRGYNLVQYSLDHISDAQAKKGPSHILVHDMQYEKMNGQWIVTGGTFHFDLAAQNPSPPRPARAKLIAGDIAVTRTSIDLSPDFQKLNVLNTDFVPDGTPVTIMVWSDESKAPVLKQGGLRYVWKDGKPIPDFDPALVEKIRKQVEEDKDQSNTGGK